MMNTKTYAEILCTCLEFGLIPLSDVISWADKQIEQSSEPDITLIELSMAGTLDIPVVAKLLRDVPGELFLDQVYQGVFSCMRATLIDQPEAESGIVHALYKMAMAGDIPDKAASSQMFWFYDALDLAKCGYTGDIEEVRSKLHTFLDHYSSTR